MLGGVAANAAYDFLKPYLGSLLVLVVFLAVLGVRLFKISRLSKAVRGLLKDKNHAIQQLLNVPLTSTTQLAQIQHAYNVWESEIRNKLHELRRKHICTEWPVDHFIVLGTFSPVASGLGNQQLSGEIAEKAQRLKDIAKDLDDRAARLWPL